MRWQSRSRVRCGGAGTRAPPARRGGPRRAACDRAHATASRLQRTSLLPWTEIFLGEVALGRGAVDQAAEQLDHAYALGSRSATHAGREVPCAASGSLRRAAARTRLRWICSRRRLGYADV